MKTVGYLWNDKGLEIVEQNGEMYVLYGWNGEGYFHCWKVLDSQGLDRAEEDLEYTLIPVYEELEEDEYIITRYDVHINQCQEIFLIIERGFYYEKNQGISKSNKRRMEKCYLYRVLQYTIFVVLHGRGFLHDTP